MVPEISLMPADLIDRRGQLLGRRRHRRGERLAALRGLRKRRCGSFLLGGSRGHGLDDLPDGRLEIPGEPVHVGFPLLGLALFQESLFGPHPFGLDHVGLEDFDRAGHVTDLVAPADAGNVDRGVASGKTRHCASHRTNGPRDAAADQERHSTDDDERNAERDQHPALHRFTGRHLRRLGGRIGLRHRGRMACNLLGAVSPGEEVGLVFLQLLVDIGLDRRREVGIRHR